MLDVLFVGTRNSVRSILAESILRWSGKGRFRAFSAGCAPAAEVNYEVLAFLGERHLPTEGLHPKSVEQFVGDAPRFAFVIALSQPAAARIAAVRWSGDPVVAHWPLDEEDGEQDSAWAIRDAFWVLSRRIKIFANLPHGRASRRSLENKILALESWQ